MAGQVVTPATYAQTEDTLGAPLCNALAFAASMDLADPSRILATALRAFEPESRERMLAELQAAACEVLEVDALEDVDEI